MLTKLDCLMLLLLGVTAGTSGWLTMKVSPMSAQTAMEAARVVAMSDGKTLQESVSRELPDFAAIRDVRQKKQAFFDFMVPMIEAQNYQLLQERNKIKVLQAKSQVSQQEQQWLRQQAIQYKVDIEQGINARFFESLLSRVDIIPVSLALAQSANESAWGTSRFATEGNNLFGQWCFSRGCGLVPAGRPDGATYEVRKFTSVADSVAAYIHNLNTHHQYKTLRALRQNKRNNQEAITGPVLAQGLYGYSIRGLDYVDELISMIAGNDLIHYDVGGESSGV